MATTYTVQAGDTLPGIAFDHGFRSWETIYNHSQNEVLRQKRPNPGELYVGDQVYIPDKEPKTVQLQAFGPNDDPAKKYTFTLKTLKTHISLYLEDEEGDPYANADYEVKVTVGDAEESYTGVTNEEGLLAQAVSPKAKSCVVTLWPDKANVPAETVTWTFEFGATAPN
jgi:hypothetical protein